MKINAFVLFVFGFLVFSSAHLCYCQSAPSEMGWLKKVLLRGMGFDQDASYLNRKLEVHSKIKGNDVSFLVIDTEANNGYFSRTIFGKNDKDTLMILAAKVTVEKDGLLKIDDWLGSAWGGENEIANEIADLAHGKPNCYRMDKTTIVKVSVQSVSGGGNQGLSEALQTAYENNYTYPENRDEIDDETRTVFSSAATLTGEKDDRKVRFVFLSIQTMPPGVPGNAGLLCALERSVGRMDWQKPSLFAAINTSDKSNTKYEVMDYPSFPSVGNKKEIGSWAARLLTTKPLEFRISRKVKTEIVLKPCP